MLLSLECYQAGQYVIRKQFLAKNNHTYSTQAHRKNAPSVGAGAGGGMGDSIGEAAAAAAAGPSTVNISVETSGYKGKHTTTLHPRRSRMLADSVLHSGLEGKS